MISLLASVTPGTKIDKSVTIQPFAYIEDNVEVGNDCITISYASVLNGMQLGRGNKVHQHAMLEAEPQDFHYKGKESSPTIGDNNHTHESIVISRTTFGGGVTKIDSGNSLMDKVCVCRDVQISDNCTTGIGTTAVGECTLDDCTIPGGSVTLH